MAFEEFWMNVANATRVRQPYAQTPEAKRITREAIDDTLDKNNVWCQKRSVQGFKKEDWEFLGKDEADRLEKLVRDFLLIVELRHADPKHYRFQLYQFLEAEDFLDRRADELSATQNVSSADPLPEVQTNRILERLEEFAKPIFASILKELEFHRFGDAEAFRIGKEIERRIAPDRPGELAELRFETGPDSTDDPGLWVWAFITELGEHDLARFHSSANAIESILDPIARAVAPERWPYILFRSTLDQLELEATAG